MQDLEKVPADIADMVELVHVLLTRSEELSYQHKAVLAEMEKLLGSIHGACDGIDAATRH